jgi:hypothetical protein
MLSARGFVIVTLLLGNAGAHAQTLPARVSQSGQSSAALAAHAEADRLYYAGQPAESLNLLRSHLNSASSDEAALWRAARAALAIGWLEPDEARSLESYREAEQLALRAIATTPRSIEAHYVLAAALGRRALIAKTPRSAAALANEVHREATLLLQLDAQHAGGHSVLGQLHAEVMRKPWAVRAVGLRLGGGVEFKPSWESAERELRRAIELEPGMMLHRFELARVYADTRRHALSRPLLDQVVNMPVVHPMDRLMQQQARRMLETRR